MHPTIRRAVANSLRQFSTTKTIFEPIRQQPLKLLQTTSPLIKQTDLVPNYDINHEILSVSGNLEEKMKEVPQTYEKWEEVWTNHGKTWKNQLKLENFIDYKVPRTPKLPLPDPRDNHLQPYLSSDTLEWKHFLIEQRKKFQDKKFVFFEAEQTREILKNVFDATEKDLDEFENVSDNMNHDPTIGCRKMSNYRLACDFNLGTVRRLSREPYILDATDGLKGPNTGLHRFFGEVQDWVMNNSAFQGMIRLKAFMMKRSLDNVQPRPGCDPTRNFQSTGNFHRVFTLPNMTGNPTIEGVHQDGVEFIMTTFIKSSNIDFENGAATTTILSNDQPLGTQYFELDPKNILSVVQKRKFLDTLFFIDTDLSHVVSPLFARNKEEFGFRDVFVSTTRRLAKKDGHFSSAKFDNENLHPNIPSAFGLYSKHLMNDY